MDKAFVLCISLCMLLNFNIKGQQKLNDFEESTPLMKLKYKSGRIDSKAKNPLPNDVNGSAKCAKYIRTSSERYDNIKYELLRNMMDVSAYATYKEDALKIRMKVYTSAPPGTLIEIQLAKNSGLDYPMSVHSQYQAYTTKQNEWEDLEFNFSLIPKGTLVKGIEINQINILFAPDVKKNETFYFDDIIGPMLEGDTIVNKNEKRK
jgi:hypothetical protein